MQWLPPYGPKNVKVIYTSDDPIENVDYSRDCQTLFVRSRINKRRTIFVVHLDEPDKRLVIYQEAAPKTSSSSSRSAATPKSTAIKMRGAL